MQVVAEKEDEREIIKKILSNHGIDNVVMANSVTRNLFYALEIQKKKYN
jgi:hypothetical protein